MTRPEDILHITAAEAYRREIEELKAQLAEARETLEAIRSGEVDAVVVDGGAASGGQQVYTLQNADRPYRLLIEQMQEGALTLTPDGIILYCNRALAAMLRTPQEQVIGAKLDRFVATRDGKALAALVRAGARRELVLTTGDGALVPVQMSFADLTGDGEPILCGVVTDLTEAQRHARELAEAEARHAADRLIRESEARYRLILESATDYAIIATDRDGRVTIWNAGARKILGWDEAEILGRDVPMIWTPEDRAAGVPAMEMAQALAAGRAEDERWHLRKDGSRFWANGLLMTLRGEDGEILGFLKILRDRTEQREAEAAVVEKAAELEAVLDAVPAAIWIARDTKAANIVGNRASYELLHLQPGANASASAADPAERPTTFRVLDSNGVEIPAEDLPVQAAARGTVVRDFEEEVTFDDGSPSVHLLGNAIPLRDAKGRPRGAVAAFVDITERKRAETALQRLNATLEEKVAQRTADLAAANMLLRAEIDERERVEEALRQSQKMEAVGQLTGGIAHDFNNLLTGIIGSLELLQKRVAEGRFGDVARYVAVADTAAQRAAALTQRLLAFSRRQALDPKPVDINKLVVGMEDLVRRTTGEAIIVETVLGGGLWPARCDANQLESALLNLCINARDAMPEGGRLTIETGNTHLDDAYVASQPDVAPGQYVCVSVSDTGSGMAPEVMERVFEPFFTTKPIGLGTGLGLSMIHGFIKQSNGHVRLYSQPGQGTTVRLYLPRERGQAVGEAAPARVPDQGAEAAGETVLVVEDEPAVRMLVVEVLEELGYRALEAVDGRSALRLLDRGGARIDLLVTDVGLPGDMNGRQLADQVRELRPGLKVLFITGYAHNAAVGNCLLEPGMDIVGKPFTLDALAGKIRTMITGAG